MPNSKQYYQQDSDTVLTELNTTRQGLTTEAAKQRLAQMGPNQLVAKRKSTLLEKFISQFKDLMIIILLVAALVAGLAGERTDAIIILLVVVLNAVFGVFQEAKAENAIDSLKQMASPMATVLRDGNEIQIKSTNIVPGDIVLLAAGDIMPADMRLISTSTLKVEEAALTGESVPVMKQTEKITDPDLPLGDRTDMGFMNSNVTTGRGVGVVVGTGMQTEVGKIATMLDAASETTTPLQENLKQLGKILTVLILIIAVIVFGIGMWRGQESLIDMILTAISLAVAAIPEGLPAIVTITLALGTQQMAKQKALIRKLPAVETLGSTDIIASDKTGTLTQNKITVEKLFVNQQLEDQIEQLAVPEVVRSIMILNNDGKMVDDKLVGDPTETALQQYYLEQGVDVVTILKDYPRVAELPFDSERKLMTTFNKTPAGDILVTMKGAPDQLLQRVNRIEINGQVRAITAEDRQEIMTANHEMAAQALRVLALAYRKVNELPSPAALTADQQEQELIFVGLIGMIDPERPEAAQAVADAKAAGIKPIMITGDHSDTASAIALRLGILADSDDQNQVITGSELDQQTDKQFDQNVTKYSVYARVAPEHKVRIVNAWQKQGKVVAMTGDGVNDAPALKAADIGIGMGITGTEVSKEASDMVLADDNFATIVKAVQAGRKVFANIQKALQYLLSANLGEVLTLFVMTFMGWQILAPVQILWINLVTDTFPAIALGVEPAEKGLMDRQPRGRQSNFLSGGVMSNIIYQGILEGLITLGVYAIAITFPVHTSAELAHADALTMAYATLGLLQLFHAFNSKTIHQSIFTNGLFKNKFFNWATLISAILLIATIAVPGFNQLFHVTELTAFQWLIVVLGGILMVLIVETVKFIQRRGFHLD